MIGSGRWELNPRSLPWQGSVVPLNYARLVLRAGVEPASDALQAPAVTTLAISANTLITYLLHLVRQDFLISARTM